MSQELVSLGGTLDRTGEKPPIGGSSHALIDRRNSAALLIDFGIYHVSDLASDAYMDLGEVDTPYAPQYQMAKEESLSVLGRIHEPAQIPNSHEFYGRYMPNDEPLDGIKNIYVVASHGHADHIGLLPWAKKKYGDRMHVYMTSGTLDLGTWNWHDYIKIAKKNELRPLFNGWDIIRLKQSVKTIRPGDVLECGPFRMKIYSAGHILGAVSVLVTAPERIFFTGDSCYHEQHTVGAGEIPVLGPEDHVHTIVTESTYASNVLPIDRLEEEARLAQETRAVLRQGGRVIFPSLAIGRSGEIYEILRKHGITDSFPVHILGSACTTNEVYCSHDALDPSIRDHFVTNKYTVRSIMRNPKSRVVIAPSGNVRGGFAVGFVKAWAGEQDTLIALSSYQDPCKPGSMLMRARPGQRIILDDEEITFRAMTTKYQLTAHMNGHDLERMREALRPERTLLVHGSEREMDQAVRQGRDIQKSYVGQHFSF